MSDFNDNEGYLRMEEKCRKRFKQHKFLGVPTAELSKEELEVAFGAVLAERNSLKRTLHFQRCFERERRQRLGKIIQNDFDLTILSPNWAV